MKKLLVVGALPDEKNGLQYGGATVLTKVLVDYLAAQGCHYAFAQTNRYSNLRTKTNDAKRSSLSFFKDFLVKLPSADVVMFNFSDHGVVTLFPYLSFMARKLGKKVVLRKFGGSFDLYLRQVSPTRRKRALRAIEKSDLILFETRSGIKHLLSVADVKGRVEWFPNVRKYPECGLRNAGFGKRLAFLSHISDEKGVGDILTLSDKLGPDYRIDLYGAIVEDKYRNFDWNAYGVNYHGEISSTEVLEVLLQTDLLLLPSYREGYPGILIEAMSVGVPVLTTDVGGIPEMITDGKEGIMIKPGDIVTAARRIKELTADKYDEMSRNARATFREKFEADSVNKRILDKIAKL